MSKKQIFNKEKIEDDIKNYRNGEFELVSILEFKASKSKIRVKHKKCDREMDLIFGNLVCLDRGCKFCDSNRMDAKKIKSKIEEDLDYECISCKDVVYEYAEIKHKNCGNIFKMKPNDFLYNKHRCPFCFKKPVYTESLIKDLLKEKFSDFELIEISNDKNIKSSRRKMKVLHIPCQTTSSIIIHNFFINGQRCKECSKQKLGFSGNSKRADIIENFLNENSIAFEKEKTFEDMVYIKQLRLDFYIKSLNIAIEYDGKQHFKTNEHNKIFTTERLEIQKERDAIKTEYCKNNNIKLIRFNYLQTDNEILEELRKIFNQES